VTRQVLIGPDLIYAVFSSTHYGQFPTSIQAIYDYFSTGKISIMTSTAKEMLRRIKTHQEQSFQGSKKISDTKDGDYGGK